MKNFTNRPVLGRHGIIADLFIGLVAVISILGLVLAACERVRDDSKRVLCRSNLRMIGAGLYEYIEDNGGFILPRARYEPGAPTTQFTGAMAASPWVSPGVAPNDVTAALFLLLKSEHLDPALFVCPATDCTPAPSSGSNFPSENNLSYSMLDPYRPDLPVFTSTVLPGGSTMTPDSFALLADLNPGAAVPAGQIGNSSNHFSAGQNILYLDIHVDWATDPVMGTHQYNIYTGSPRPASEALALLPLSTAALRIPSFWATQPAFILCASLAGVAFLWLAFRVIRFIAARHK